MTARRFAPFRAFEVGWGRAEGRVIGSNEANTCVVAQVLHRIPVTNEHVGGAPLARSTHVRVTVHAFEVAENLGNPRLRFWIGKWKRLPILEHLARFSARFRIEPFLIDGVCAWEACSKRLVPWASLRMASL